MKCRACLLAAAREGNLEVLKWGRARRCEWGAWTCAYAALGGYLERGCGGLRTAESGTRMTPARVPLWAGT